MKIRIIGGPGSGKSYLAEALAKEYGIAHYDLDDLQWKNELGSYAQRREPEERARRLEEILAKDDWIMEGVYYGWCPESFRDADRIYLLRVPRRVYRRRILRRFFRRHLGLEGGMKESISALRRLLRWADTFDTTYIHEVEALLEPYRDKVIRKVTE